MQLAMIGLGRMGGNMAKRIAAAGHEVVGYDRSPESDRTVASLEEMVAALTAPRIVWVMVPAGEATDSTINELAELLEPGDMIIDGGNSRYTDDARHAAELEPRGIHFMDCGVSGGVWGIDRGYALMVGGSEEDFERARPIFEALKPEGDSGLVLAGPVGGGHFAKMVHNGIEYGMMQAFGEGFATMVKSDLIKDPAAVMTSWRDGSVVQSWLLDLLAIAFKSDPTLESMPPVANESGEAKWMIEAALELGVPTPSTAAALYARQTSRGGADDILRVVSTMRAQFGGHGRNGQTGPKNISPTVRFTGNGHPNTKNQPMNVRFCRNGHSTQLKNAYLAYIWQTSSAKRHFGGTFLAVLTNRPAIYKRDSSGQGCVSAIYKAETHPFGLFASEFLQRAHTGLSGRRLRARTFRMRR